MKKTRAYPLLAIALLVPFLAAAARAGDDTKKDRDSQDLDELKKTAPKVFIDGSRLDIDYIRTEITFVNYVWDRKEADVHVLITQQRTGGGGREYTIAFIGLNGYANLNNELKFYSNRTETDDDVRKGMVQILKLGLAHYAARTPRSKILSLSTDRRLKPTAVVDTWDFWVFSFSTRGRLSGEKSRKYASFSANISLNRVTLASKFRLGFSGNIDESRFDYVDFKDKSSSRFKGVDGLYVRSLGEHWSVGGYASLNYSTYSNIDTGISIAPAIEFDVFPYSQSTRHQLRILYRIGPTYNRYIEETIYDKLSQTLVSESLTATLSFTEPWGSSEVSVEGSHYFHDFSYNRLRIGGSLSLRILKGLALTVDGRYAAVHDQISLRKSEVSLDDLLLRRKELATGYNYSLSVGFSYSFGSVYSNVVNPRFGGGFGGPGGMGGGYNY
jgi:hypothetical protein